MEPHEEKLTPPRLTDDLAQLRKSLSSEELAFWENIKDRNWRIENLYYIKDKAGNKILFKLNWAQKILMDRLWFFSLILKARQLGITTFFCILYLDQILFSENRTAGIIAHRKEDAQKIFRDKVKFAWDNLPQRLRDYLGPPDTDTAGELSFPNGSKIFVSTSTRSGTIQFLHISEFAWTCSHYPGKAEEIVTGSINSVEQGQMVTIESTADGKDGYFYDFCQEATRAEKEGRQLSTLDFKFFFFPWWQDERYRTKANAQITTEYKEYFNNLAKKYNVVLDAEQKQWYMLKKKINQDKMYAEYPSTPEEAFLASVQGAYYSSDMARVYSEKRIRLVPYDSRLKVHTFWDLGMNDENVIIFAQANGSAIHIIDTYANSGEGLAHYVKELDKRGYVYERHVFPHDVEVRELGTGQSRRKTLSDLGMRNIQTVKKSDILDGIEAVRRLFTRMYFDEEKTAKLTDALANYRKEWDDRQGIFKNSPVHDKYSHYCDALRTLAMGWKDYYSDTQSKVEQHTMEESFF